MIVYGDNQITLIENLNNIENHIKPVHIEMVVNILCLKGKASFSYNSEKLELKANDLFVCYPNSIVVGNEYSNDFEIRGICLSRDYMKQLITLPRNIWETILYIEKSPLAHLDDSNVELLTQYYNLMRTKILNANSVNLNEILDLLTQTILCEIQDVFAPLAKFEPVKYTSSNLLFSKFMGLLSTSLPHERTVTYYADRLFVSPKYLSAVCKELTGNTASAIINTFIVKEIERLLKMNTLSIKEIANELNFSSISFFGKYVRKKLGMSPKHYRELLAKGKKHD